jgi:CHAT domain-containing protein
VIDVRVLVVDDEIFWQEELPKALHCGLGEGLRVDVAPDYQAALTAIQNKDYDLISVDLGLPDDVELLARGDLPGMHLLAEIRRNPRSTNCGLVVLSAHQTVARVRKALRSYNVYDFLDKFEFTSAPGGYIEAAKSAIRGTLLEQASAKDRLGYRFILSFNEKGFVNVELTGPNFRSSQPIDSPKTIDFADLAGRADRLNSWVNSEDAEGWRREARSIGEALYKSLIDHAQIQELLATARALTGSNPSNLALQFSGPPSGLSVPFELTRDSSDYLVLDHIMTRHLIGVSRFTQRSETFSKFIGTLVKDGKTMRVLVVGANSDEKIPAAEDEAASLARSVEASLRLLGIPHYVNCLTGDTATSVNVKEALRSGYHLFHYAGHADYAEATPEKSPIILRDGVLTASDLKVLLRETDLRLLFLSSCLGARGAARAGRGDFHGFLHALFQAGVPSIIGYRWEVADGSAESLARDFYRALFRSFCPGEALLRARRNCTFEQAGEGRDDATWASPVLLCDY